MRVTILGASLAGAALLASTLPAAAGDTTVTFTVPAGSVAISAGAASANLANVTSAAGALTSITGDLPAFTVTDTRNQLVSTWSVSATMAGNFVNNADATKTVPKAAATVAGPATGTMTPASGVFTPLTATMAVGGVIASATSVGNNSAVFTPTMTVAVPLGTTPGTYTGTLTVTAT